MPYIIPMNILMTFFLQTTNRCINFCYFLHLQVKLRCPAVGHPGPLKIRWFKDGLPIEELTRPRPLASYMQKPELFQLRIPGNIQLTPPPKTKIYRMHAGFGTLLTLFPLAGKMTSLLVHISLSTVRKNWANGPLAARNTVSMPRL